MHNVHCPSISEKRVKKKYKETVTKPKSAESEILFPYTSETACVPLLFCMCTWMCKVWETKIKVENILVLCKG